MLSKKNDFIEIDDFQVFSSVSGTRVGFLTQIDVLVLTFTNSICLVFLSQLKHH